MNEETENIETNRPHVGSECSDLSDGREADKGQGAERRAESTKEMESGELRSSGDDEELVRCPYCPEIPGEINRAPGVYSLCPPCNGSGKVTRRAERQWWKSEEKYRRERLTKTYAPDEKVVERSSDA